MLNDFSFQFLKEKNYKMETQHLPEQATPGFYEFPLDHEESFSVRLLYDRWASFYHKNEHVGFNLFKIDEKKCSKDWQVKGFKSNEVFIVFKKIKQKKKDTQLV